MAAVMSFPPDCTALALWAYVKGISMQWNSFGMDRMNEQTYKDSAGYDGEKQWHVSKTKWGHQDPDPEEHHFWTLISHCNDQLPSPFSLSVAMRCYFPVLAGGLNKWAGSSGHPHPQLQADQSISRLLCKITDIWALGPWVGQHLNRHGAHWPCPGSGGHPGVSFSAGRLGDEPPEFSFCLVINLSLTVSIFVEGKDTSGWTKGKV